MAGASKLAPWILLLAAAGCAAAVSSSGESSEALNAATDRDPEAVDAYRTERGDAQHADNFSRTGRTEGRTQLRIMAANITSGNGQSYDPGEGVRMFQGLKPDVVLIQEFNVGANTPAVLRTFVDSTFGASYNFSREKGAIPNGIISRYPIVESGSWPDPEVSNRTFAWAKIAIPGSRPLWAVSVHFLTTSSTARRAEATALTARIKSSIPAADYLVVGGDFNTDSTREACLSTLTQAVVHKAPFPRDGGGNNNTNSRRNKPLDWVLADAELDPLEVPTRVGAQIFPRGLVFDSRVFRPIADVEPVRVTDSAATNMQHMPVVRDFSLPVSVP